MINLSVVIAVYSETYCVLETIDRILKNNAADIGEIILVVSPYSTAECLEICEKAARQFPIVKLHIQKNNPGQGLAIREGFQIAKGTHIVTLSADLETQPETIGRMVDKLKETNCDVVVANRWKKGGGCEGYGLFNAMTNYLYQEFLRNIYKTRVGDLTYGFKLYNAQLVKKIKWECTGHEFCLESILKLIKLGAKIEEVPTKWAKRKEGKSKRKNLIMVAVSHVKTGLDIFWTRKERFIIGQSGDI